MLLKVVVPTLISLILSVLAASYFLANLRFDGSAAHLVFGFFALLAMSRLTRSRFACFWEASLVWGGLLLILSQYAQVALLAFYEPRLADRNSHPAYLDLARVERGQAPLPSHEVRLAGPLAILYSSPQQRGQSCYYPVVSRYHDLYPCHRKFNKPRSPKVYVQADPKSEDEIYPQLILRPDGPNGCYRLCPSQDLTLANCLPHATLVAGLGAVYLAVGLSLWLPNLRTDPSQRALPERLEEVE